MSPLTHHEITILFLALGTLLLTARLLGELARRFGQPAVLGEILAGILLGPTVLGRLLPDLFATLFEPGRGALALQGITSMCVVLFLLVAGLELDLMMVRRQGRAAATVGVFGLLFPAGVGISIAWLAPQAVGWHAGVDPRLFAFFFGTALAISALPVIARTLMDLGLYHTDLGMIVMAAAVLDDLVGWLVFALLLSLLNPVGPAVIHTVWMLVLFVAFALTLGSRMASMSLPWLQSRLSWPGGVLAVIVALAFFGAAFAEWIGVHAVFGSFMVGVMLGSASTLREHTRAVIGQFVSSVFAPLFFATIGLRLDFARHFDPLLTLVVIAVACVGKVMGCYLGGRLAGLPQRRAWAVGFGMNSRGAMEIILGLLAVQNGLIDERMFVALVVMALVTSMLSGPAMQALLGGERADLALTQKREPQPDEEPAEEPRHLPGLS